MRGIGSRARAIALAVVLVIVVAPAGAVANSGSDQYCDPFGGCQVNGGGSTGGGGKKPGRPSPSGQAPSASQSQSGGLPGDARTQAPGGWQLQGSKEFLAALAQARIARARTIRLDAAREVLEAAGLSPLRIWFPAG